MILSANNILQIIGLYSIKIIGSVSIFLIGMWLVKKISSLATKILQKTRLDITLTKFFANVIDWLLILFIILAALSNLGIETTSFIAILGAVGFAVGMAFKDTFSNLGAGVLIIFFRPFKVGDFVDLAGVSGNVEEVNLFSTFLTTTDNKRIIIPNLKTISGNIINYSTKPTRRVELVFGIGYDDDIKKAKEILINTISSNKKVLKEPPPFVAVSELADSSVNFIARAWVKKDDYYNVYYSTIEEVKLAFDEAGITIPYPQISINNSNNPNI